MKIPYKTEIELTYESKLHNRDTCTSLILDQLSAWVKKVDQSDDYQGRRMCWREKGRREGEGGGEERGKKKVGEGKEKVGEGRKKKVGGKGGVEEKVSGKGGGKEKVREGKMEGKLLEEGRREGEGWGEWSRNMREEEDSENSHITFSKKMLQSNHGSVLLNRLLLKTE